jgi:hypothetical protein
MQILLIKGNDYGWFWKIPTVIGRNIESKKYLTKWRARHEAKRLAKINKYELREVTDRG